MRDLAANFAKTTLASGIGYSDLTFTVATGTGALFPNPALNNPGNLIITIESEILLCSGVSGDGVTVLKRGYENTNAVAHASGATVALTFTAGMLEHLWANVPDTYQPDVPPAYPSMWNDEFETNSGLWSLYPQDNGAVLDYGVAYSSNAYFARQSSQTTFYYLYQGFAPTGAFQVTCKLRHAGNLNPPDGPASSSFAWFFVSDQQNPTSGLIAGNRALIGLGCDPHYQGVVVFPDGSTHAWPINVCQQAFATNSVVDWNSTTILEDIGYQYLSITYDGSTLVASISTDGIVFPVMASASLAIVPQSLGWVFQATGPNALQAVVIDWVRVTQ